MQATIGDVVVAAIPDDQIVRIEGNDYFPPSSITREFFTPSQTAYTCPWKGPAQYWDLSTPAGVFADAAWSYPDLYDGAAQRVGQDFTGYVAFDPSQVAVTS